MIHKTVDGLKVRVRGTDLFAVEETDKVDGLTRLVPPKNWNAAKIESTFDTFSPTVLGGTGLSARIHVFSTNPFVFALWIGPEGTEPFRVDWWLGPGGPSGYPA